MGKEMEWWGCFLDARTDANQGISEGRRICSAPRGSSEEEVAEGETPSGFPLRIKKANPSAGCGGDASI